jgi:hypothetical protein
MVLPCAEAQPFKTCHTVIPEHSTEKYSDALNWDLACLSVRPPLEVLFGTNFNYSISLSR